MTTQLSERYKGLKMLVEKFASSNQGVYSFFWKQNGSDQGRYEVFMTKEPQDLINALEKIGPALEIRHKEQRRLIELRNSEKPCPPLRIAY